MSSAATATARLRCVGCLVKLRYEPDAVFITCPRCETRFNPKLLASVRLRAHAVICLPSNPLDDPASCVFVFRLSCV
jgi:hypothetical protein